MLDKIKHFFYRWQAQQQCKTQKSPSIYCGYLKEVGQLSYSKPLDSVRFVVFDSESTGLNPKKDRILSIGAVAIQGSGFEVMDSYESTVFQDFSGGKESIPIHGIRQLELSAARPETEVILEFLQYIGDAVLVAHHAWFDTQILHHALRRHWNVPLLSPSLDTLHLAKRFEENTSAKDGDYTLDALAKRYDVRILHRHTAAGDALVTAELLIKLLRKAKKRGVQTLGELL